MSTPPTDDLHQEAIRADTALYERQLRLIELAGEDRFNAAIREAMATPENVERVRNQARAMVGQTREWAAEYHRTSIKAILDSAAHLLGITEIPAEQVPIRPPLPVIPSIFLDGTALMPSSLAVQGVLAGYRDGQDGADGWQDSSGGLPSFRFAQGQGAAKMIMRPLETIRPTAAIAETLWQQVRKFSDNDGDVLLAMMAQAIDAHDDEQDTWITASKILDYRGIQPIKKKDGLATYRAGHRTEDIIEVAECVERLAYQWIELQAVEYREVPAGKKKAKVGRYTHESRIVNIEERVMHTPPDGSADYPVAWRYRLGRCIRDYLVGPNRQVATLVQRALQYDPYRRQWEKRLAIYFTIHNRIAASYHRPLRREIGKLLTELKLPIDADRPGLARKRFESAMDRLVKDQVLPSWSYGAESTQRLAALPSKNWLPTWLSLIVELPPALDALPDGS